MAKTPPRPVYDEPTAMWPNVVWPTITGLVCSACQRPVAIIENRLRRTLLFFCPACRHRWTADEPDAPET